MTMTDQVLGPRERALLKRRGRGRYTRFERGHVSVLEKKTVACPMPLISDQSLFSYRTWVRAFSFVNRRLMRERDSDHAILSGQTPVTVRIRHLYFCKYVESSWRAVQRAHRILKRRMEVSSEVQERNDRNNELWLSATMKGLGFRVYDYKGDFRFAVGDARGPGGHELKNGKFSEKDAFTWNTTHDDFLTFVQLMEIVLRTPGITDEVRAYLDIDIGSSATIRIGVHLEQLPTDLSFAMVEESIRENKRDYSRFSGVVPPPVQEIVFH